MPLAFPSIPSPLDLQHVKRDDLLSSLPPLSLVCDLSCSASLFLFSCLVLNRLSQSTVTLEGLDIRELKDCLREIADESSTRLSALSQRMHALCTSTSPSNFEYPRFIREIMQQRHETSVAYASFPTPSLHVSHTCLFFSEQKWVESQVELATVDRSPFLVVEQLCYFLKHYGVEAAEFVRRQRSFTFAYASSLVTRLLACLCGYVLGTGSRKCLFV